VRIKTPKGKRKTPNQRTPITRGAAGTVIKENRECRKNEKGGKKGYLTKTAAGVI